MVSFLCTIQNNKLKVRLCSAIDPTDAHAIDVLYHNVCWANNVTNVLRSNRFSNTLLEGDDRESHIATDIEFISILGGWLEDGNIMCMATLEKTYNSIAHENGIELPIMNRKKLKQLILEGIPNVEFSKPKKVNEPERVMLRITKDAAVAQAEELCSL